MNWKFEAIEKLKGYEAHKQALESIPLEIALLESQAVSIRSAGADSVAVSGGGCRREDAMLSNIVKREELQRQLEQATKWVQLVELALAVLTSEQRIVLDAMYIRPRIGNVDRLCERLCVEKAAVYRRRDDALLQFARALYGIE